MYRIHSGDVLRIIESIRNLGVSSSHLWTPHNPRPRVPNKQLRQLNQRPSIWTRLYSASHAHMHTSTEYTTLTSFGKFDTYIWQCVWQLTAYEYVTCRCVFPWKWPPLKLRMRSKTNDGRFLIFYWKWKFNFKIIWLRVVSRFCVVNVKLAVNTAGFWSLDLSKVKDTSWRW